MLHPPLQPPLWVATLTCSGRTRASKHKCLGPMEMSTNQPSGQPVGGWGGEKPAKTQTRAAFLAAEGGHLISADKCGAVVGLTFYHSGSPSDTANHFAWLAPLGSASKKQFKTRIPERFLIPKGSAKAARERTSNRRRWPPYGFPKGVGRGGRGANSSKTRVLAPFCHRAFI